MHTIQNKIFGETCKPVIGMVHLRPTPGSYNFDQESGLGAIIESAAKDIIVYQEAGFDGLLFCNESDMPFSIGVSPSVVATMTYCITQLKPIIKIPFGVDVILDNKAAIAIASITGGKFVRGIFTNAYVSEMGIINTNGTAEIMFKKHICADEVAIFARVSQGIAAPLIERPLDMLTYGAIWAALADAVVVTGRAPGDLVSIDDIETAKRVANGIPIIASNGISIENVESIVKSADCIIVGTKLKIDNVTLKPVEKSKAFKLMDIVAKNRKF